MNVHCFLTSVYMDLARTWRGATSVCVIQAMLTTELAGSV